MGNCGCGGYLTPGDRFCGGCGKRVASQVLAPSGAGPDAAEWSAGSYGRPVGDRDFAAALSTPTDQAYVAARLQYRSSNEVENELVSGVDAGWLTGRFKYAFMVGTVAFVCTLLTGFFLTALTGGEDVIKAIGVAILLGSLCGIIGMLLFLSLPSSFLLSEWGFTVEGRAEYADGAVSAVYRTLVAHRIPVPLAVRRIRGDTTAQINTYLTAQTGRFHVFMGVRPYGDGLYLAWSMWRRDRPILLLGRLIGEGFGSLAGKTDLNRWIDSEPARAMREAIHNAMREGIESAVEMRDGDLAATFGADLPPVEEPSGVAAPVATPVHASVNA